MAGSSPRVSIVIPAKNEGATVPALLDEIDRACAGLAPFEIVYVDDGSTDDTPVLLAVEQARRSHLRVVRHAAGCGKSAAIRSGVRAAAAPLIVTVDGDGQNDPAFVPDMVALLERDPALALIAGQRLRRGDSGFKGLQSRIANGARGALLRDGTRDTACGLKAIRREVFLALPYFDTLHRFLPALVRREGWGIAHFDVVDRPRLAGQSHYGLLDRLLVGIPDLFGVWWLIRRRERVPQVREIHPEPHPAPASEPRP
ncbi:MAG TPA: glycosyltransferase family 2 protein [Beijerinckiaceae bacterium]|jgi:glycosyltransferase involved in cell wall biosynthesis